MPGAKHLVLHSIYDAVRDIKQVSYTEEKALRLVLVMPPVRRTVCVSSSLHFSTHVHANFYTVNRWFIYLMQIIQIISMFNILHQISLRGFIHWIHSVCFMGKNLEKLGYKEMQIFHVDCGP